MSQMCVASYWSQKSSAHRSRVLKTMRCVKRSKGRTSPHFKLYFVARRCRHVEWTNPIIRHRVSEQKPRFGRASRAAANPAPPRASGRPSVSARTQSPRRPLLPRRTGRGSASSPRPVAPPHSSCDYVRRRSVAVHESQADLLIYFTCI